jgi:D-alanyl-lipoteichoic acid acyltransferase DltB (MBOAT superfamily)
MHFDTWNLKELATYHLDLTNTILCKYSIVCIEFPVKKFEPTDYWSVYIAFTNGVIIEWSFLNNKYVKILNFDIKNQRPHRLTDILGLYFPIPRGDSFYALTSGSLLIEYDIGPT